MSGCLSAIINPEAVNEVLGWRTPSRYFFLFERREEGHLQEADGTRHLASATNRSDTDAVLQDEVKKFVLGNSPKKEEEEDCMEGLHLFFSEHWRHGWHSWPLCL